MALLNLNIKKPLKLKKTPAGKRSKLSHHLDVGTFIWNNAFDPSTIFSEFFAVTSDLLFLDLPK